jgi:phosphate transport system substrate-binding protein
MRTRDALMILALGVGTSLLALGCGGGDSTKGGATRLDGAGSSFVDPMMQEWASAYNKAKGVKVNYQSKGSGAGISMMTQKEVDFGCSDAPLNKEQLAKAMDSGGEVIHIPLCMGGIVPAYNLEGLPDLVFSGQVLMDIYLGKITKWNDPAIAALNKGKKLPDEKISVCFRSDSSGSTDILTDYFTKINKEAWTPGRGTAIKFPVGTGAKGTDGVAGFVKQTGGAIGYVELIYAMKNNIPYGSVLNSKQKAIKADMTSVTAAAAAAEIPDDLRYSITNSESEDAYPISGTVWAILYTKPSGGKGKAVQEFLQWVTHDGQKLTEKLHYAALPEKVVKKIDAKLALVK